MIIANCFSTQRPYMARKGVTNNICMQKLLGTFKKEYIQNKEVGN